MTSFLQDRVFSKNCSLHARFPLTHHPSPLGHGWELVDGRCRPVRHTQPALPTHLPAPGPAKEREEDESEEEEGDDDVQRRREDSSESDDSESSEAECYAD